MPDVLEIGRVLAPTFFSAHGVRERFVHAGGRISHCFRSTCAILIHRRVYRGGYGPAVCVQIHWADQDLQVDSFRQRRLDFFLEGGHFIPGAAVKNRDALHVILSHRKPSDVGRLLFDILRYRHRVGRQKLVDVYERAQPVDPPILEPGQAPAPVTFINYTAHVGTANLNTGSGSLRGMGGVGVGNSNPSGHITPLVGG